MRGLRSGVESPAKLFLVVSRLLKNISSEVQDIEISYFSYLSIDGIGSTLFVRGACAALLSWCFTNLLLRGDLRGVYMLVMSYFLRPLNGSSLLWMVLLLLPWSRRASIRPSQYTWLNAPRYSYKVACLLPFIWVFWPPLKKIFPLFIYIRLLFPLRAAIELSALDMIALQSVRDKPAILFRCGL